MSASASTAVSPGEVIAQIHRAVLAYDLEAFAARFAPDGVLELPFLPEGPIPRRLEGREAIRRFSVANQERARSSGRRLLGIENRVVHQTSDPEVVIVEFEVCGEWIASGQTYRLPYIQVWRIRGDEVLSMRDYFSARTVAMREASAE